MPLLDDIRRFFQREKRKPVEVDLTGSPSDPASPHATEDGGGRNASLAPTGPKGNRAKTIGELQRGYDEVMQLVRKVGDHLEAQTKRTERLIDMMERLPQAIDALPEINRQNARLLDVLSDYLSQTRSREQALNETLSRLGESSSHHTEVLSVIQQQLDTNHRASEQMTETLSSFRDALSNLAATNNRSTDILSRLTRAADDRESKLTAMFQQTQRWMIAIGGTVGALALIAIILAILAMTR